MPKGIKSFVIRSHSYTTQKQTKNPQTPYNCTQIWRHRNSLPFHLYEPKISYPYYDHTKDPLATIQKFPYHFAINRLGSHCSLH